MDKKYCLGLYEKAMPGNLTMAEKLTAAREAGYDYLEMSVDETDEKLARLNMSREERKELTLLMEKTGMPIRSMCLSGHRRYSLGSARGQSRVCASWKKQLNWRMIWVFGLSSWLDTMFITNLLHMIQKNDFWIIFAKQRQWQKRPAFCWVLKLWKRNL